MKKNTQFERLLEEALSNAEKAGIKRDSLSCLRTLVSPLYKEGNLFWCGRATNGLDEKKPFTLQGLIELNNSEYIRVVRDVSRHVYGPKGEDYVAYSNVCKVADCDAGNPKATLWKATKLQNDKLFELEMEMLKPKVVISMVGDSVGEDGWSSSIWDGYIKQFPGQYHKVLTKPICERYTATLWKLRKEDGELTWFIFADRPDNRDIKLQVYVNAINGLIDDITRGLL